MGVTLPPFQAFMDSHSRDVHRFLTATVGPDEADDCFQETFIAALRAYPRLRPGSNLRAWILTIAHRKALDSHRARSRRPKPVAELPEAVAPPDRSALDGDASLWRAVLELPPKQRAAVVHRFVSDLSYGELADVMAVSEEAARRSVHEGLKKLRVGWQT